MVLIDGTVRRARTHFPAWLCSSKEKFAEYEISGEISDPVIALEVCPGVPAVLFRDNHGANATVEIGPDKTRMGRPMASSRWNVSAATGGMLWAEYLSSLANPSDPLSRMSPLW